MNLTLQLATVESVALASVRIAVFLTIAPPFSFKGVPGMVKAGLSLALGILISYKVGPLPDSSPAGFIGALFLQAIIGAALGFLVYLVFAAVQSAGSLIDLFGGFQMASAFDPMSMSQATPFARLYQITALALLFASDGYQLVLGGLLRSFDAFGLTVTMDVGVLAQTLTHGLGQMFIASLQIAGPLIGVLFLADVGLGLLTKAAPALNAFSLGFALKILLTLAFVGLAMVGLPQVVGDLASHAFEQLGKLGS